MFATLHHNAHRKLQTDKPVSDNGEGSPHHPTMAGRIFQIVLTESHCAYVIMEAFDVSESRDGRYGMPTMHANPDRGYQTIVPSVSCHSPL